MAPRKSDRVHREDHSDGDPHAGKQAQPVVEWTVEGMGGLAAMGAHFTKHPPDRLAPPTPKLAKITRRSAHVDWARLVARNYDPLGKDRGPNDRAMRSRYNAIRKRCGVSKDEPHLIAWAHIGMSLVHDQPEFAPKRGRGRPPVRTLPPGGKQALADAEKRMGLHSEPFNVALAHTLEDAERNGLAGDDPAYFKKKVKRYLEWKQEKAHQELVRILAGTPRQKIGTQNP